DAKGLPGPRREPVFHRIGQAFQRHLGEFGEVFHDAAIWDVRRRPGGWTAPAGAATLPSVAPEIVAAWIGWRRAAIAREHLVPVSGRAAAFEDDAGFVFLAAVEAGRHLPHGLTAALVPRPELVLEVALLLRGQDDDGPVRIAAGGLDHLVHVVGVA